MIELEDYECDGCRNDGNTSMGCGDCLENNERIREWNRKYGDSSNYSSRKFGGFISD